MLNKSVLNYYSHFSSLFPDFFFAIVFYSSRRIVSDKKKSCDIKKEYVLSHFYFRFLQKNNFFQIFFSAIMFYSPRRIDSDKKNHVTLNYNVFKPLLRSFLQKTLSFACPRRHNSWDCRLRYLQAIRDTKTISRSRIDTLNKHKF